jgi:hypothetical protein
MFRGYPLDPIIKKRMDESNKNEFPANVQSPADLYSPGSA